MACMQTFDSEEIESLKGIIDNGVNTLAILFWTVHCASKGKTDVKSVTSDISLAIHKKILEISEQTEILELKGGQFALKLPSHYITFLENMLMTVEAQKQYASEEYKDHMLNLMKTIASMKE